MTATPTELPDEEVEQEAVPALYHHCVTVYNQMFKEAKLVQVPLQLEDGTLEPLIQEPILVYEGHLTRLFQKLHLSVPYYTTVTRDLKRMGCITQLRRGGGSAPSQWQLHREPTEEAYREAVDVRRVPKGKNAMLEQQVRDLSLRVSTLEDILRVLMEDKA